MFLEWCAHEGRAGMSVTLTYAPAELPAGGNLSRRHSRLFRKRLRKALVEAGWRWPLRMLVRGEYAQAGHRPHYHALIFGLPIEYRDLVERCWAHGHVHVQHLDEGSFTYVTDHMVGSMSQRDDPRLQGREPEFVHWPRAPALGVPGALLIVDAMRSHLSPEQILDEIARTGDVPSTLRVGGRSVVLDKRLKDVLRDALLSPELAAEVRAARAHAYAQQWTADVPWVAEQRIASQEARRRIFRQRESLR